ncbi:unnamed protein product [Heligmosomoides polygyrus]|uniref:PITH domain-containing protein n=1 Tax=Heligmosomoides polygyrus TaxID=6339 RepID=A0A183FB42_HELPZ|nr:unnamed protein product [Heligmosomoides polygyrus]
MAANLSTGDVPGQSDITSLIDKKQTGCLNGDDSTALESLLEGANALTSDCDEQLILSFPFNQLLMKDTYGETPKILRVFSNLLKIPDFDRASSAEALRILWFTEN